MKKDSNGKFYGRITIPALGKCTVGRDGIIRSSHYAPRTSTTLNQYLCNARVRNAAAVWNALKPLGIAEFFSGVKPYNTIASDASSSPDLYGMVKLQKEKGLCSIAPVLVSYGEILSVQYDTTFGATDISIGDHTIDESTMYSDFCQWILDNNPSFVSGDRLTLIFVSQLYVSGYPSVKAQRMSIYIDPEENKYDTLADAVPDLFDHLSTVAIDYDENALTVDPEMKVCAFAFVHSGNRNDVLQNSTQRLVCRFDPWSLQLPLLREEFKSISKIPTISEVLTPEENRLLVEFGFK